MKTLFRKFMAIYIGIMLLVFFMLIIGLNSTLKNYFIDKGYDSLIEQSLSVQQVFGDSDVEFITNTKKMIDEIADLERHFNTKIWIIDKEGVVFISQGKKDVALVKKELKLEEVNKIFSGEIIKRQGHYKSVSNEPLITVGYPIIDDDGQVKFALYTHKSLPEVLDTTNGVFNITIISMSVSVALATILIFFFSRRYMRDISKLNKGVNIIATGNYDYKLEENRNDEIGALAINLNKMSTDMKKLEIQRRNFISDVSHDFRSPLTNIIGFSEGIIDGSIHTDDQIRYLEIIRDESKRLVELSSGILDLSIIQDGKNDIEKAVVNVESLILNVLDRYEQKLIEKKVEIIIEFSDKHENAICERRMVERVINNLIDNAIKFVNVGGSIELKTKVVKEKLQVSVRNTGSQIDQEKMDDLWLRFSKGDVSRGAERQSFGLGLAIVKEIIDIHEESIFINSDKKVGVTFMFTLLPSLEREN